MISEVIYVDGGQKYAEYHSFSDHENTKKYEYVDVDGVQQPRKSEREEVKHYKRYPGTDDSQFRKDCSHYDLCPDVRHWGAFAHYENSDVTELYFMTSDSGTLNTVANYYNLPSPLNDEIAYTLDNSPRSVCLRHAYGVSVVVASVKFDGDMNPVMLKLHFYPSAEGLWKIYMTGDSYVSGGEVYESGAVYHKSIDHDEGDGLHVRGDDPHTYAESIVSEKSDGSVVQYIYNENSDDPLPLAYWVGHEITPDGKERIKRFETSAQLRELICNLPTGDNYKDYDLCPSIHFWMGHSWYEGEDVVELYFWVEDSSMIQSASAYYALPDPTNPALRKKLDEDPASMRVRHYDMLGEGEGNFLPVVVGGVEFTGGVPTALRLYSFGR